MVRLSPVGERALQVTLDAPDSPDPAVIARARRLRDLVDGLLTGSDGYLGCLAAYRSVLVEFDPLKLDGETVADRLERALGRMDDPGTPAPAGGSRHRFALCACAACAPDRSRVEQRSGMPFPNFLARYAAVEYRVWLLGFLPGFPFLGPLHPSLRLPRHDQPRTRVEVGSVGIGGAQTGVYSLASPGGWNIIGRIGETLFAPLAASPVKLAPGDTVLFEPTEDHRAVHGGNGSA